MANIVNAIINLLSNPMTGVQTHYINKNRHRRKIFFSAFYPI